jgi:hypothetical protein
MMGCAYLIRPGMAVAGDGPKAKNGGKRLIFKEDTDKLTVKE